MSGTSGPVKDDDGDLRWFDEHGELHREDGPAVINDYGLPVEWWYEGKQVQDPDNTLPTMGLRLRAMVMAAYTDGDDVRQLAGAIDAAQLATIG